MKAVAKPYQGIFYMLLAALGFSIMGGAAKSLKDSFNAGQLVFYRNAVGFIFLMISFLNRRPVNQGGKLPWLAFRGLMGTIALYTLLFCILHMPLGTAMTYNLTSTLFIALFSFILFGEYHGKRVLLAVLLGFTGMLLIYKPNMHLPLPYHLTGLVSGITSALAYMTVGRLAAYYDPRTIVLSFLVSGIVFPVISMLLHHAVSLPADDLFIIAWRWPQGEEWMFVLIMALAALFGQYFVTRAYGADKAGIVSTISYSNIVFSILIGIMLGDAFPDIVSLMGICCIMVSGMIISLMKRRSQAASHSGQQ
ncbi:MAG TPA: DMT family transporter [Chitinophagaceae bacterium]|nr:DMT family transporter [Chitinophagaceae bacterium]